MGPPALMWSPPGLWCNIHNTHTHGEHNFDPQANNETSRIACGGSTPAGSNAEQRKLSFGHAGAGGAVSKSTVIGSPVASA